MWITQERRFPHVQRLWAGARSLRSCHLDQAALDAYFSRLKQNRRALWQRLHLEEKELAERLLALDILGRDGDALHPTLAGLLAFGTWPQKLYRL